MRTLFMLLISTLGVNLFSQQYIPIRSDSTEWIVEAEDPDGEGGDSNFDKFSYVVMGDSMINDTVYQPVYYKRNGIQSLFGFIYQDYEQKRIYSADPIYHYDRLLYDFSLSINDTLKSLFGNFIVESIDSILIDGEFRKRILFNEFIAYYDFSQFCIIEGIGSNAGLFPFDYLGIITSRLTCYKENGNPIESMTLTENGCDLNRFTFYSREDYQYIDFQITPNPFSENINIELSQPVNSNLEIIVVDIIGQIVYKTTLNSGKSEISLLHLSTGIYSIIMTDDVGHVFCKKIIKI